jgi:hypothetical protein
MMVTEEYLRRSRLFRRLKSGLHGQHVERYAARLVEDGRARHGHLVSDVLNWTTSRRCALGGLVSSPSGSVSARADLFGWPRLVCGIGVSFGRVDGADAVCEVRLVSRFRAA